MIYDYIKWGGFPLRFDFADETSVRRYISNLYEGILSKDIIKKARTMDKQTFYDISLYIFSNAGKEFSADNIANYYKSNNKKNITGRTINTYLDKLRKSYLLHTVGNYNISGKSSLKRREKFYATDTSFRMINTNTINYEDTFFLENIVYNELLVQGFDVYVGKTFKGEVDFVAVKDGKKCFIQVAYLLASTATIEREFGAYDKITDASPKYVLSMDKLDMSRNGIIHMSILDFLLHEKSLMLS